MIKPINAALQQTAFPIWKNHFRLGVKWYFYLITKSCILMIAPITYICAKDRFPSSPHIRETPIGHWFDRHHNLPAHIRMKTADWDFPARRNTVSLKQDQSFQISENIGNI